MKKTEEFLKEFDIQFSGLKLGLHEYQFKLDKKFFDYFKIDDITDGDISVDFTLTKRETMMEMTFDLMGTVTTTCDRCMDELKIIISDEREIMAKFSDENSESTDELIILRSEDYKIDIAPIIYEFIVINLPLRKVHDESECNPKIIAILYGTNEEVKKDKKIDSTMWNQLKKLKKD
jgi:uncharacterized metal-binding protein YceD (DUF177 family)